MRTWSAFFLPLTVVALSETQIHAQGYAPAPPVTQQPGPGYPAAPPGEQQPVPGYPMATPGQPAPGYPATSSPPVYSPEQAQAVREEQEDSGLGLEWAWINAEVGASYVNLQSLNTSSLALQKTESGGPVWGVGVGARLFFFTVGVHLRDAILPSIGSLWQIDGEVAFHTRFGHIDPYFGVRGGYNFIGSLSADAAQGINGSAPPGVSVHGFNVGPMFGVDYYFTKGISLGVDLDAEVLFIQRPVVALTQAELTALQLSGNQQLINAYQQSGSSIGLSATIAPHLGLHF